MNKKKRELKWRRRVRTKGVGYEFAFIALLHFQFFFVCLLINLY